MKIVHLPRAQNHSDTALPQRDVHDAYSILTRVRRINRDENENIHDVYYIFFFYLENIIYYKKMTIDNIDTVCQL